MIRDNYVVYKKLFLATTLPPKKLTRTMLVTSNELISIPFFTGLGHKNVTFLRWALGTVIARITINSSTERETNETVCEPG